jgi:hypothetical protein
MKKLLSVSSILGMGMITVCVAAIAFGRSLPDRNSLASVGLGFCNDAPCFLGITPGITIWSDVQARFADVGSTIDGNQLEFNTAENLDVYLIRSDNKAMVSAVFILFKGTAAITAGSLIAHFGMPCSVTLNRRLMRATLEYPTVSVDLILMSKDQSFIDARTPVISLTVSSTWNRCAYGPL